MKSTATPELIALLRSPDPVLALDLLEITLADGTVLRYTTADMPIPWGGHTWDPGILWERSEPSLKAGLETDNMTATAFADENDLINGIPFHDFVRRGGFEGAYLVLRWAYYSYDQLPPFAPVGALWGFSGKIWEPMTGGLKAQFTVKSPLAGLNQKMPWRLYQAPCGRTLYDAGCGVDKDDYAVTGAVQAGSTAQVLQTVLSQAAGWFDLGWLEFTSGALDGTVVTIKRHGGDNTLTPLPPLLQAPAPGDTFTAWPGCDHTMAACQNKFTTRPQPWYQYYGGLPFIPQPETAR